MPQITQWDEFEYWGRKGPDIQYRNRTPVKLKENKSEYIADNDKKDTIYTYRVDGGIIKGNAVQKCDFLFLHDAKNTAYFIELKGKDFKHAIEQLEATITNPIIKSTLTGYKFKCRVSCTQLPAATKQSEKLKSIEKFKNSYSTELRIEKTPLSEPKL